MKKLVKRRTVKDGKHFAVTVENKGAFSLNASKVQESQERRTNRLKWLYRTA